MMKNESKKLVESVRWHCNRIQANLRRTDGKFLLRQETRMRRRIQNEWKKQLSWVLKEAKLLSFFDEDGENSMRVRENQPSGEIKNLLQNLPGKEGVVAAMMEAIQATLRKGGKSAVKNLELGEFGISFDLSNPNAIKYLEDKKLFQLSNMKGTIHDTTHSRLSGILTEAAETGASYTETAKVIQEQAQAGVFSRARGELIAVRENALAYETGNAIPIRQFDLGHPGRTEKFWETVGDDRVTPTHTQNEDDGWIPLAQSFSGTGDEHAPGSDNPRCRCATLHRIN